MSGDNRSTVDWDGMMEIGVDGLKIDFSASSHGISSPDIGRIDKAPYHKSWLEPEFTAKPLHF